MHKTSDSHHKQSDGDFPFVAMNVSSDRDIPYLEGLILQLRPQVKIVLRIRR